MTSSTYHHGSRENVKPFTPQTAHRILEIGCGEGRFREHFPGTVEYWGVELHPASAAIAASRLYRVLNMPIQDAYPELPRAAFDLVICNDVIEHLPDHDAFFQQIRSVLTPNGCIVGSIPNVRYVANLFELLIQKDWQYKDEGILDRTHLRFFTERSLRRTFEYNGYQVEMMQGIDPATSTRSYTKKIAVVAFRILFGDDTRYRQFGFRVRPIAPHHL